MKKIVQITTVVSMLLITAGCAVSTIKPQVNCEKDVECTNNLIAQCNMGTFITGSANAEAKFTIIGKQSDGCKVEWGFLNSGSPLSGFTMSCNVPLTIKSADEMFNYLFNNKYQSCNGELKDKITKPVKEVFPELNKKLSTCTDTECVNKLLVSCEKGGSFTRKTVGEAELKFSIQAKVATGCVANAQFIRNSNQNLVGPQMRCMLPTAIQTVADVDNLIKNKFVVSDEYSSSNVCSGELYKLIKQ